MNPAGPAVTSTWLLWESNQAPWPDLIWFDIGTLEVGRVSELSYLNQDDCCPRCVLQTLIHSSKIFVNNIVYQWGKEKKIISTYVMKDKTLLRIRSPGWRGVPAYTTQSPHPFPTGQMSKVRRGAWLFLSVTCLLRKHDLPAFFVWKVLFHYVWNSQGATVLTSFLEFF